MSIIGRDSPQGGPARGPGLAGISKQAPREPYLVLRGIGIVFQSYALFPNLTVFDNVAYGLVNRRMQRDAIARRVEELLTIIGLPEAGPKYPNELSGGEQQRVGQTVTLFLSLNHIAERSLGEGSTFKVRILGDRMRVFES